MSLSVSHTFRFPLCRCLWTVTSVLGPLSSSPPLWTESTKRFLTPFLSGTKSCGVWRHSMETLWVTFPIVFRHFHNYEYKSQRSEMCKRSERQGPWLKNEGGSHIYHSLPFLLLHHEGGWNQHLITEHDVSTLSNQWRCKDNGPYKKGLEHCYKTKLNLFNARSI